MVGSPLGLNQWCVASTRPSSLHAAANGSAVLSQACLLKNTCSDVLFSATGVHLPAVGCQQLEMVHCALLHVVPCGGKAGNVMWHRHSGRPVCCVMPMAGRCGAVGGPPEHHSH
jgi:hypothetical protein